MQAPFSFWAASPLARARFRRLFAAMSLVPSICRFCGVVPGSPPHGTVSSPLRGAAVGSILVALRPAAYGTVVAAIALLAEGAIASGLL